ncbi:MAG: hypothetical protein CMJ75_19105 [Planctomycetaceae bacterium]|nr:hypothetical protein [Planctomycetaceae bacterium]
MFDDNQVAWGEVKRGDAFDRNAMAAPKGKGGKKEHPLDSARMVSLHRKLLGMYERELERQGRNRMEMAVDEDFYDNIQWDEADAALLKERGQMPLVFNVISASINWVLGTEKRGRSDFRILPRRKEAGKAAERKTQLLKYLSDVNRSSFSKSRAFEDAVKVGIGWIESGVQDDDDGEPVYDRYESWRNVVTDSTGTELDLSDARYQYRSKWVDLDVAEAMFPERVGVLRRSAQAHSYSGVDNQGDQPMDSAEMENEANTGASSITGTYERKRVRLIEGWIRLPTKINKLRGGEFGGEVYDEYSPGHVEAVESGQSVLVNRVMMRMHCCIFTADAMLFCGESPYRHNHFPLTPIWCYRRGRDGLPYGMIRGMRDIQYDINKRAAKALHILSSNKVIMDEGAVEDLDAFAEEVSRPDAIIVKKFGKELVLNADRELASAHMEMMSRDIAMIQQLSGVTDENLGRQTNATSGKAIGLRQQQGSMATAGIFDNLRLATQIHGEKMLSLMEQYFSEEKQFRITNMRGNAEYITINDGLPENDIIRTKADFIISEADWRATVRQGQTEELMALLAQMAPVAPQLAMVMIDLIVEEMDIGNRDELVKRIRQVTGMRDPDAEELTPEEQQAEKAKTIQAQLQQRAQLAEIADKEASAAQKQAKAAESQANIQKVMAALASDNTETQRKAIEVAQLMLANPYTAPVADTVLHESGFVSRTEQELNAEQLAAQQAEEQAMAEAQAMQEQQAAQQEQAAAGGQPAPQGAPVA